VYTVEEHAMAILTFLVVAMTFIMTLVMALKLYRTTILIDLLYEGGYALVLRLVQEKQNKWVLVHLGCGIAVFLVTWLFRKYIPEAPESASVALALYAGFSFLYAVLESVLAYRIDKICATMPVPTDAGVDGKGRLS